MSDILVNLLVDTQPRHMPMNITQYTLTNTQSSQANKCQLVEFAGIRYLKMPVVFRNWSLGYLLADDHVTLSALLKKVSDLD